MAFSLILDHWCCHLQGRLYLMDSLKEVVACGNLLDSQSQDYRRKSVPRDLGGTVFSVAITTSMHKQFSPGMSGNKEK